MELKLVSDVILPYLEEEDFEQMRIDTQKLVVENEMLKKRISHLEYEIVTHAWAGWNLH
jgi:hypothetical protein